MIGLGRLRVGVGAVGLTVAGLCWMPEGMADSFHLKTGDVVEGEIIQATRNTVVIRSGGAVRPTSIGLIERVVLTLADGSELNGEFVSWKNGVYEVHSADLPMKVKDGKVIDDGAAVEIAEQIADEQPVAVRSLSEPKPEPKPTETIAMQGLPEFTLRNGQVLIGQVIHVTGSIATIRLHKGGVVPTSRAQIERVRFVAGSGDVIAGSFVGWSNDVYQLKDDDQDVAANLSEAAVQAGPSPELQSQSAAAKPLDKPAIAVIESTDAAAAPDIEADGPENGPSKPSGPEDSAPISVANDSEASDKADATGTGGPVSETAIANLAEPVASSAEEPVASSAEAAEEDADVDKASAQSPHLIEPTVADVGEDGEEVVFEFRLNKPADRPLVFLYAATDDTAKAGKDFEAKSGVVTFGAGSKYAEVRVPLIDDEQSETSEQFHLFLSGDPETIQFSERQIPATINDND